MTLQTQEPDSTGRKMSESKNPDTMIEDEEIDLFALWETLLESKWLVLSCAALCFALATALAFVMTPKYEARIVASFADEGKSGGGMGGLAAQYGGLAEMAGISLGSGGSKEASLAFLNSRAFIEQFIQEEKLLPILYEGKWDAEQKQWKIAEDEIPTMWKAYKLFSKDILSTSLDKKTSLLTLTITWKNREQAVYWANELVRRANETLRHKTITETQSSLDFLQKELEKTSIVEVQNTIYRVMETQVKSMMMANTQEQFAFKVIDPAIIVDEDAFVKPKRPLMMALGLVGGLFLGVVIVFLRKAIQNHRAKRAALAN